MSTKHLLKITALIVLVVTLNIVNTLASTIVVNSNVTTNTTWLAKNKYVITGYIYVTNNAALTIEAGTWIQGDSATKGSLIITRGAKIMAIGTACKPIVFTSAKSAGHRARGDWGGLIILGNATVNWPGDTGHIEGITPNPNTLYGGGTTPNDADNSGTLQYVRIEFAGIALAVNNEINGLTMGGVGSGTTIDHVQVSYSNDDSYEWFGGAVNCKYLIAYNGLDDDFDTDNGYSGRIQFGLGMRDPNVADVSGSHTFESDNDPTGTTNTPQTSCVFQNMTCLGGSSDNSSQPLFKQSAQIRRNSNEHINNSILMGYPVGILVDGNRCIYNCQTSSFLNNNYLQQASGKYITFAGWVNPQPPTLGTDGDTAIARANLQGNGNVLSTTYSGVLVNANYPITNPSNLIPAAGNPLPAANEALYSGGFWTDVSYVGAFNPAGDNWAGDWTQFDPINTTYTVKMNFTPTVTTNLITNVICPNTGAVDINVTAGTTPYSYSWSNGATTQDISSVAKGAYTVTVYDAGKNCSVTPKKYNVKNELPLLTTCNATSTSITVFWAGNLAGHVTGYQIRYKKHTVSQYGSYINVGNGTSTTITGLLSNTQYDFQLRGTCISGNTAVSAALTCSTTARLGNNENSAGQAINIYPNPSAGQFKIDLNGFASGSQVSVKVTNVLGETVYSVASVSTDAFIDMNLESLSSGMYNVIVSDGSNQLTQNIVLNK